MKVTVLGATGGIGTEFVRQALDQGWHVTAVVRDPARLAVPASDRLDVVTADLDDHEALLAAVVGRDVLVSTLGARDKGPTTVCADGARAAIAALRAAGVRRLVVVSASGMHTTGDGVFTRTLVKPLLGRWLRHGFADMRAMEDLVTATDLDWTVVRPPMLTNGPRTGAVAERVDGNVRGAFSISRADAAGFLVKAVSERTLIGASVSIAHG